MKPAAAAWNLKSYKMLLGNGQQQMQFAVNGLKPALCSQSQMWFVENDFLKRKQTHFLKGDEKVELKLYRSESEAWGCLKAAERSVCHRVDGTHREGG